MISTLKRTGGLITVVLLLFSSCYYDTVEELDPNFGLNTTCDTAGTISFSAKVQPILTTFCGTSGNAAPACHGQNASSGIPLVSYADVVNSAAGSLMDAINHSNGASPMPKGGGKLDDCRIAIIQKWIDQGAENN